MKKKSKSWLWIALFGILIAMIGAGCDSGASTSGCDSEHRIFEGDYAINVMDDMAALSGYTEITGTLTINNSDLTNLKGLNSLSKIGGDFILSQNAALMNLNGICKLSSVRGNLIIRGNPVLADLNDLSNLISVGGNLSIQSEAITDLEGLSNLASIGGSLTIADCTALQNINDLQALRSVGGDIGVYQNNALLNVDGLSGVTSFTGGLQVSYNASLLNIDGLRPVTTARYFKTWKNQALENLDGLINLTSIEGELLIENTQLTNIDGLQNLASVGALTIKGNDLLLNIDGLKKLTHVEQWIEITHNPLITNLNGLDSLTTLGEIEGNPHFAQFGIVCNASLPLSEVDELIGRLNTNGWNGCYFTAITCPPIHEAGMLFDQYTVHGWCDCMQWFYAMDALNGIEMPADCGESPDGVIFVP